MQCGLLGRKLGHSYSPRIHSFLGEYSYDLMELEPEQVGDFLRNGDFSGLNVTIPYKKTVIPFLDELSETARLVGAVNTIVRRDGRLIGYNTDYYGFSSLLSRSGLCVDGKKCLVLGSGGASATAQAVLKRNGAQVIVISRGGENHYGNLDRHSDAAVIVNTTPVGMYPDCDGAPVSLADFSNPEGVLDVIYNPANTRLLQQAQLRGITACNGLWMLVAQAAQSAALFQNTDVEEEKIGKIHDLLRREMENIILIGMPGSGKSTIGQLLAEKTGKEFADSDTLVFQLSGKTPAQVIAQEGEEAFRRLETQALAQLGKQSGLVIATGGGCVTRPENYALLHQNGQIVWLRRPVEQLSTAGRPISQAVSPQQLYRQRVGLYEAFCDRAVENHGTPEQAVSAIMEGLQ